MTAKFNIAAAAENLRIRSRKRTVENKLLFEKATSDAAKIIHLIITKYNPVRIYHWGSLLHEERFSAHSDIDIAVEGLTDAEEYFNLIGDVMKISNFKIDLVQMEKIEPEFAESIKENGKVVYEKL